MILSDPDAERGLLSVLLNNTKDVYIDISDIGIHASSFTLKGHRAIYDCIYYCFENNDNISLDTPMIISASKACGYEFWFSDKDNVVELEEIKSIRANANNRRNFAKKIKKLEVIRNISDSLDNAKDRLLEFTGNETIGEAFGVIEDEVLNMSSNIISDSEAPIKVSDVIDDYIQDKIDNPIEQVGISTGFPRHDQYWGGGLRNGSIYVVCARAKGGKSLFLNKVGTYVSQTLKIPVLYLFLEMSWEDQIDRMLASSTGVRAKDIETGQFASDPMKLRKVREQLVNFKNGNFYCKSIAGKSIEDQLNLMRRWIIKEVGVNPDGTAKPCLILYDYVRLADAAGMKNMQEHQAVGFLLESISHFVTKYKIPILTAAQQNRSALERSDESTIGISDRIAWLCAGISLLETKSPQELSIEEHGMEFGNKKLRPILARYGPGIEPENYINCIMKKDICDITEGITAAEAAEQVKLESREYNEENDDDPDQDNVVF